MASDFPGNRQTTTMSMNIFCLAIDRLHWGYLGAYGNTWNKTPHFDRLAAESFVFDRCFIDTPKLGDLYRSLWTGGHAYEPVRPGAVWSLPAALGNAGWRTLLVTDDTEVARHPLAAAFRDVVDLGLPAAESAAESAEQTLLARTFARLIEQTADVKSPFFLWCHLAALGRVWDVPWDERTAYLDGDDPDPPTAIEPPNLVLDADFDPDVVFGWTQAYAAQVRVLDLCLGAWSDCLETGGADDDTALILLGTRGYPLGEHRRLGPCDDALYAELTHVPLLLRLPGGLGAGARSSSLIYPADLTASLWELCQPGEPFPVSMPATSLLPVVRGDCEEVRDRLAVTAGSSDDVLITPAWYYRRGPAGELFVQPDDPWLESDVADRCRDLVVEADSLLVEYRLGMREQKVSQIAPLAHSMRFGVD
jgi:arylsulfatase A-like enzyme